MLKALIASPGDHQQRVQSIQMMLDQMGQRRSIELNNTLIMFYGHFGDIVAAEKVFEGVPDGLRTGSTLNHMMHKLKNSCHYSAN